MSEQRPIPRAQTHRGVTHEITVHYGHGQDSKGRSYIRQSYDVEVSHIEDGVTITAAKRWLETRAEAEAIVRTYRERWER